MQAVLLLLNLWNNSHHDYDNRVSSSLVSAPLIPLLRRFEGIHNAKSKTSHNPKWEEVVLDSSVTYSLAVKIFSLVLIVKSQPTYCAIARSIVIYMSLLLYSIVSSTVEHLILSFIIFPILFSLLPLSHIPLNTIFRSYCLWSYEACASYQGSPSHEI